MSRRAQENEPMSELRPPTAVRSAGQASDPRELSSGLVEAERIDGDRRALSRLQQGRRAAQNEPDYAAPRPTRRATDLRPRKVLWRRRYSGAVVAGDLAVGSLAGFAWAGSHNAAVVAAVCGLGLVGLIAACRGYEHRFVGHGTDEFRRVCAASLAALALGSTWSVGYPELSDRRLILLGIPLAGLGVFGLHLVARLVLGRLRRNGRCQQRVVAVGLERSIADLIRSAQREPSRGFNVVAACVAQSQGKEIEGVPVAGGPGDAATALTRANADTVVLTAWSDVSPDELRRLSWDIEGSGVELLVAPRLAGVTAPRIHLRTVGGVPLLRVEEPEFSGVRRVGKTLIDYTLAGMLLLVALPVMVGLALAVKFTSPGPILFRQDRVGRHGEAFVMHKFRSMYTDAETRLEALQHLNEHANNPMFKIKNDPRVTPIGRFIRRYSLDELPQLFDVVLGRMSLIGPRPPLRKEVALYGLDVRRRLRVKPGLTGLWQVSGRSDLTWEEAVRLDLHYVENWSLALDLSILFRTAKAVLGKDGAY